MLLFIAIIYTFSIILDVQVDESKLTKISRTSRGQNTKLQNIMLLYDNMQILVIIKSSIILKILSILVIFPLDNSSLVKSLILTGVPWLVRLTISFPFSTLFVKKFIVLGV